MGPRSRRRVLAVLLLLVVATATGIWLRGGSEEPPPEPNGDRSFQHLVRQVECGPRSPGSPGVDCCRSYILNELRRHADHVALQEFSYPDPYGADTLQLANLLASFHPKRTRRVLLGAHYDTRPRADADSSERRNEPILGANDGGSGVAVLLEIARCLALWDPGLGVDLVFFDGEDYGREGEPQHYLLGSKHFVRQMGAYRPLAVIVVDMVGKRDLAIPMERYSLERAPKLTRLVFDVAESLQVASFVSKPGPPVYDDHIPFLERGIPALDLIDFDFPAWHTHGDVPEVCSPQSLEDVTRVLLHSLARLGRLVRQGEWVRRAARGPPSTLPAGLAREPKGAVQTTKGLSGFADPLFFLAGLGFEF